MYAHVAVLSDVHAVLPALHSVLAEPDVAAADAVLLTGDLAAGPQPVATLDTLQRLGERAIWVRGNADRELVDLRRGGSDTTADSIVPWAAQQLREDQVELLATLPDSVVRDVAGLGRVLFCHATPRDDDEVVLVDSRLERWSEVLADLKPDIDVIVCGHTHMPFVRVAHGRLIVNPGSVGMPYGRPGAHWALIGPGVQLRRTLFDPEAACARIEADCDYPEVGNWLDFFVRGCASDAEALATFGPRDGRDAAPEA